MRFRSQPAGGYVIHAVSGVNTISFAIDAAGADTAGLLGFGVERLDPQAVEQYFMYGFKVFKSVFPAPTKDLVVSTRDHPVQSFVWDDFTAKSNHRYTYRFHPLKGTAKNIDRSAAPISIEVRTEPLYTQGPHDVFFNRGVASSQAYERRFGNTRPDDLKPASKRREALDWLSRDLDNALLKFINNAKAGDTLLGCFYEFRYEPVATALKKAIDEGVDVQLIIDAKVNEHTDSKGKFHESFPRVANRKAVQTAGIPAARVHLREARRNDIQHNKFMVLLKGAARTPAEVWTGSTNISIGGIHGQTNVGHWVRDRRGRAAVRGLLAAARAGPRRQGGGQRVGGPPEERGLQEGGRGAASRPREPGRDPPGHHADLQPAARREHPRRCTSSWSTRPRSWRASPSPSASTRTSRTRLTDNTPDNAIAFFLLEKKDKPTKANENTFVFVGAKQNIYKAWGSFLREPLHQWAKETSAMGAGAQPARQLHPLQVPAARPARRGPGGRHRLGELQRRLHQRQRREHARDPRRPAGRRHLLHRVQSPVQPLLLPLGGRVAEGP